MVIAVVMTVGVERVVEIVWPLLHEVVVVTVWTDVTGVDLAGQLVTVGAHEVMVSTEVEWTVITPGEVTTLGTT